MVKAVIFDMDGVIIDSEWLYFQWLKDFLAARDYRIADEKLGTMVGLASTQSAKQLAKICNATEKLWDDFIEESDMYPIDYMEILYPGVFELLTYLKEKNIKIALASASPMKDINEALNGIGFTDAFDVVLSGEMFKESKPNPEIYDKAMLLLGELPEHCVIIEDSEYGIIAGKEAGAYVIAKEEKRFGFQQERADVVLSDMWEIKNKIKELHDI